MNTQLESRRRKYKSYERNGDSWGYQTNPAGKDSVYYGDIEEDKTGIFLEVPFCTYSDYSGCTVERSNCRVFEEQFKEFIGTELWPIYGGYGTAGILITINLYENNEEVKEVIDGLFDYPCIDEEDMSNLEMEIEDEDWDSWIKFDLTRELEKRAISYNEDTLQDDFNRVIRENDIYYSHEDAVSAYIDIEDVVDHWNTTSETN